MEAVVHSDRPTSPASPPRVRGPWRLTWDRFRRDRVSLVAACLFAGVVFASFAGGPVASAILGHTSIDQFPYAANENGKPVGLWTRVPAIGEAQSDQYGGLLPPPRERRQRCSCSVPTVRSAVTSYYGFWTEGGRRWRSGSAASSSRS